MEAKVTIICLAYNHELYLEDALKGFLMQKTNFKFCVLVHDDCSSDKTKAIIDRYSLLYPDIIIPIYELENQYSKGVCITRDLLLPMVTTKYIAFCEGDDFWTDPYKLQKQFDALEANPDVDICTHAVSLKNYNDGSSSIISPRDFACIIPCEDVISGGGGFVATCSLFFRKSIVESNYNFFNIFLNDYVIQVLGSLRGGMMFLPDIMATYRYMTDGSWTKTAKLNRKKMRITNAKWLQMLETLNEDTNKIYDCTIGKLLIQDGVSNHNTFRENLLIKKRYKTYYKKLTILKKIKCNIKILKSLFLRLPKGT